MARRNHMVDDAFTIDEHRARTRHFDLRLMTGGSVALWTMASSMPAPGDVAQQAVRIDQPLVAGRGAVPEGLDLTPWDHGRMTVRTWYSIESELVTLHGARDGGLGGRRTVSLLHVGSPWEDDDHWSIVALDEPS